jgi:monoamine oxidase
MTYADYLQTQSLNDDDLLALTISCQLTFGDKPENLSFLYVLFYIHSAGGYDLLESMEGGAQQDRIDGGTQAVPMRLAAELGDVVRLQHPVERIVNWDAAEGGPVRLETPSGPVTARVVIMALSPSQATGIEYSPRLPEQRAALMANWPRGGSAIKVAVAYETPFWREDGLSGQSYSPNGPYLWAVDVSPFDGGQGQLMSFTMSSAVPPMTPEQRREAILAAYVKCFGEQAAHPSAYAELDWSQETYTRGCVSPMTPGLLTRFGPALRPPTGNLYWAGTETAEIWMGYMDGAVRTGHRAALEALQQLAVGA